MIRTTFGVLLLLGSLCLAGSASAQILGTDSAGYPVREWAVVLTRGHTYSFTTETTLGSVPGGGVADSVLSLRTLPYADPEGAATTVTTVAGADGCGANILPSCFVYTVPAGEGTTTTLILTLRAWRQSSAGSTRVSYRNLTMGTALTYLTTAAVAFGGGQVYRNYSGSGLLQLFTRLQPGNNTYHTIYVYDAFNEANLLKVYSANGWVGDTAMIYEYLAPSLTGGKTFVFSGTTQGPLQLLENNGYDDSDGDLLGNALERSLKTCDRTTDPDPSPGFRCRDRAGCADPTSALCKASLRDTDHDGLGDGIELLGYDNPLLWLPLWGADPAHMDVFYELDMHDQSDSVAGCQAASWLMSRDGSLNFLGGNVAVPFFDRITSIFGQAPAYLNPDGRPGINVHFDVGVTNNSASRTVWGNWGGGGQCLADACGPKEGYLNDTSASCPSAAFADARKAFFHYVVDGVPQGGQTVGDERVDAYVAGMVADHVHEMGHTLGLGHEGPRGSAASLARDAGSHRAQYPSRMNYRYQHSGNDDGSAATEWSKISFSFGTWTRPLDMVRTPEICPEPNTADMSVLHYEPVTASTVTTCSASVNWDLVGATPSGSSYQKWYAGQLRTRRSSNIGGERRSRSAASATIANNVLLYAYVEPWDPIAEPWASIYRVVWRGDGNADCTEYPLSLRDPQVHAANAEFGWAGTYPSCYRPGAIDMPSGGGLVADAVAIESALVNVGSGPQEGVAMVTNDVGTLRWSSLAVQPDSVSPREFNYNAPTAFYNRAITGVTLASMSNGRREPALKRVPDVNATLLVYVDAATGTLFQASLPAGATSWERARQATSGGYPLPVAASAPSLAVLNGVTWLAYARASDNTIVLYTLTGASSEVAARTWAARGSGVSIARTTQRPSLVAFRSLDAPSLWQFVLHWVSVDGRWWTAESSTKDPANFGAPYEFDSGVKAVTAPAVVWDERPIVGTWPDLRVWREASSRPCPTNGTSCSTFGSSYTCQVVSGQSLCVGPNRDPEVTTRLYPFPRGPTLGIYGDYNDWIGIQWGMCNTRYQMALRYPPSGPSSYLFQRLECGPLPSYPEPAPGGSVLTSVSIDDQTLHPALYSYPFDASRYLSE